MNTLARGHLRPAPAERSPALEREAAGRYLDQLMARRVCPALAASLLAALAGCEPRGASCDYAVCEIEDPDCVQSLSAAVACHLDQAPLSPEVRFLTADEYLAEIESTTTPLTTEEERDQADFLRALALAGLMPEGYSPDALGADSVSGFAAFYSPESDLITIFTDRPYQSPRTEALIMIHELVHAYQDAAWDLSELDAEFGTTFDRFLGERALVEGHAVLFQLLASHELAESAPADAELRGFFAEWQTEVLRDASESDTPWLDVMAQFPYPFGGGFVADAWLDGGAAQIDELVRRPPDSVRQVVGGYAAWPDQRVNEDAALDPQALPALPDTYQFVGGGHESAWLVGAMLEQTVGGDFWSPELEHLSADYLSVWRDASDELALVWRLRSDQPTALTDALTAPGALWARAEDAAAELTHIVTEVDGDVVLIAVTGADARRVLEDIGAWKGLDLAATGAPRALSRAPRHLACAPHPR